MFTAVVHCQVARPFGRWGESISKFVLCVARHCIDRGLLSEKGMVNGKEMSPHPGYLGGRSPNYWCIPTAHVAAAHLTVCVLAGSVPTQTANSIWPLKFLATVSKILPFSGP